MSFSAGIRERPFSKKYPFCVVVQIDRLFKTKKEAQAYFDELALFDNEFKLVKS